MAALADILAEMEETPRPKVEERTFAFWELTCECGETLRVREPNITCLKCGRELRIEWGRSATTRSTA